MSYEEDKSLGQKFASLMERNGHLEIENMNLQDKLSRLENQLDEIRGSVLISKEEATGCAETDSEPPLPSDRQRGWACLSALSAISLLLLFIGVHRIELGAGFCRLQADSFHWRGECSAKGSPVGVSSRIEVAQFSGQRKVNLSVVPFSLQSFSPSQWFGKGFWSRRDNHDCLRESCGRICAEHATVDIDPRNLLAALLNNRPRDCRRVAGVNCSVHWFISVIYPANQFFSNRFAGIRNHEWSRDSRIDNGRLKWSEFYFQPCPLVYSHLVKLCTIDAPLQYGNGSNYDSKQRHYALWIPPTEELCELGSVLCTFAFFIFFFIYGPGFWRERSYFWSVFSFVLGLAFLLLSCMFAHGAYGANDDISVPQKYFLTQDNYWNTLIAIRRADMANVLSMEKQVAAISALAEGSGIRQIERMTGVHRDTIMRLGVRVGKGCAALLDAKMRDLTCEHLQMDELWGFIGKKQKHVRLEDGPELGDVWTFCAIDPATKLVPSFKVGKRDAATANAFVADLASRLKVRTQLSADALPAYIEAVEQSFGANVDFAQVVKVFENQSADAEVLRMDKMTRAGHPDLDVASTSHVERLNGTIRLHMRRLSRLTYAFSKKLENFEAAVALHFAYYNFVKRHNTLRCTPAMAAGIERDFWTARDLVEAA